MSGVDPLAVRVTLPLLTLILLLSAPLVLAQPAWEGDEAVVPKGILAGTILAAPDETYSVIVRRLPATWTVLLDHEVRNQGTFSGPISVQVMTRDDRPLEEASFDFRFTQGNTTWIQQVTYLLAVPATTVTVTVTTKDTVLAWSLHLTNPAPVGDTDLTLRFLADGDLELASNRILRLPAGADRDLALLTPRPEQGGTLSLVVTSNYTDLRLAAGEVRAVATGTDLLPFLAMGVAGVLTIGFVFLIWAHLIRRQRRQEAAFKAALESHGGGQSGLELEAPE